jgi:hypothetical protein
LWAFDKFHIMRHLGEALDEVRKSEYRRLADRDRRHIKGQKYTLLSRRENLTLDGKKALKALLAANQWLVGRQCRWRRHFLLFADGWPRPELPGSYQPGGTAAPLQPPQKRASRRGFAPPRHGAARGASMAAVGGVVAHGDGDAPAAR